jgi:hypothetical protein
VAAVADPKKQLEWEARQRPRAGIAAIVATLGMIGGLWGNLQFSADQPSPSGLQALQRALAPGPVDDLPSLQIPRMQYIVDHQVALIAIGVVGLIASIAAGWSLAFLAVATRARRPELRRWVIYLPIVGGVLSGLYTLLSVIGELVHDRHVLHGARTVAQAADTNGLIVFAQIIGFLGLLVGAAGYLMVSLNAMRAGLLTRALGVVGIAIGVFFIIPLPLFAPLLQILFQASLALLLFRLWMGGTPPAWDTGQAEPWAPRRAGPGRAGPGRADPAPAQGPAQPGRTKRKKR